MAEDEERLAEAGGAEIGIAAGDRERATGCDDSNGTRWASEPLRREEPFAVGDDDRDAGERTCR